jgi:Peptidase family M23
MVLAGAVCIACACGSMTAPSTVSVGCAPTEATANLYEPIFSRPFDGPSKVGNDFDHDLPLENGANGYVLTVCGDHDGTVLFAGLESPRACPQLGRTVQALVVATVHLTPSGDELAVIYGHLSRIDVAAGATVTSRTPLGLSGNTGCSGTPHLHFGVSRSVSGEYRLLDPYGWHASAADPWERNAAGTTSTWLWKPGEAPALR